MTGNRTRIVDASEEGMRLDRWFRVHFPAVTHGRLEKLLRKGQVRVDGAKIKSGHRIQAGEEIRIPPMEQDHPPPTPDGAQSDPRSGKAHSHPAATPASRASDRSSLEAMRLYEDESILVLNKPYGLAVQGGTKTARHIDGMLAAWPGERPRLVHRLDRDTSGVFVLAKSRKAAMILGQAFQAHEIEKTYWALTAATPSPREGTIRLPLVKKPVSHRGGEEDDMVGDQPPSALEKMVPSAMGSKHENNTKMAVTDFQTVDTAKDIAFLVLRPRTGRTHQLRVHCAAMECPIVGDGKYGGRGSKIDGLSPRLHLFCREMQFRHPESGKAFSIRAPLAGHMLESWTFLGLDQTAEVLWPADLR